VPVHPAYVYDSATSTWNSFSGPPADPIPSGTIVITAFASSPFGWLICDGQAISRTTYSELFAGLGTTYGAGNGTTTFNIPNLKGRVVVGVDSAQTEFDALGETGGSKASVATHDHGTHFHSIEHNHPAKTSGGQSVDHSHGDDHVHSGGTGGHSADHSHGFSFTETTDSTGDGAARYDSSGAGAQGTQNYGTGGASVDHSHGFTTNAKSTQGYGTNTGGASVGHTHDVDLDNFTGNSATQTAQSGGTTSGNLQPYMALNYIIKT
jgi:microcystin-dependent protein